MSKLNLVYTTFATKQQAHELVKGLLAGKLIACANIYAGVSSMYEWEGQVQEGAEVTAILKTVESKLEQLKQYIKKHHPYDVPCIAVIDTKDCNKEFNNWVETTIL